MKLVSDTLRVCIMVLVIPNNDMHMIDRCSIVQVTICEPYTEGKDLENVEWI